MIATDNKKNYIRYQEIKVENLHGAKTSLGVTKPPKFGYQRAS